MRGELVWRRNNRRAKAGTVAGCRSYDGRYNLVGIDGKAYFTHRVLYAMYHKADPGELQIDHRDGDTLDSRVGNLRLATPAQNRQNGKVQRLGLKGAYRSSTGTGKQWVSAIMSGGSRHFLGYFDTEQEAHMAYVRASAVHHGEFGRTR